MGGAVSSGNDNNELVDNLVREKYIRSNKIEQVFRALDRANYMTPDSYDQAYKDLAWMDGPLHLSSPCIYSEVMEGLMLHKGLSFLNIGSGTGYLSSMVGLILGCQGINHGVEVHPDVHEYAVSKLATLLETSPVIDDFDFCQPKFYNGNGLCLVPLKSGYDRVYCGAACPKEYASYFRNLLKVGGILVMPLESKLVQIRRVGRNRWESRTLLSVTFAPLRLPTSDESKKLLKLDEQVPPRLQELCRGAVRVAVRGSLLARHPELRPRVARAPPPAPRRPRRICIPVDAPPPHLGALHDLDADGGADEMNALLNLVISMGHSRVAGALRYDRVDSDSEHSDDAEPPRPPRPAARARRPRDLRRDSRKKTRADARPAKKDRRGSKLAAEAEDGGQAAGAQTRSRRRAAADAAPSTSRPQEDQKLAKRKDSKSQSKVQEKARRPLRRSRKYQDSEDNSRDENDSNSGGSDEDAAGSGVSDSSEWASEEETRPAARAKRQKLDSGLGGSSPSASPPSRPSSQPDLPDDDVTDIEEDEEPAQPCPKASRAVGGADARCVRVSRMMRCGVASLPLPPALNRFINLDRDPEEE
ncbi:protein-L-isoaspartate O-methyltransferase domain-containing protein 1-like [Aricia agestis]|uniref:protein-L-isoaspartate O-methyltransferase domain-containing protein 1-like n=1 Tax=Aricia agestis TaxID=91739 RepID=UPI001C2055D9|nr:protein-L-isoaspartate O-methyltransferase domain-containing protein 1-like [Aricia agestis]